MLSSKSLVVTEGLFYTKITELNIDVRLRIKNLIIGIVRFCLSLLDFFMDNLKVFLLLNYFFTLIDT